MMRATPAPPSKGRPERLLSFAVGQGSTSMGRARFAPQTGDALYPGGSLVSLFAHFERSLPPPAKILSQRPVFSEVRRRSADSDCWQLPIPSSPFAVISRR
jgi:hypothetical protein